MRKNINSKEGIESAPAKCTHRDENENLKIDYDHRYDMDSRHMHCKLCGKMGTKGELASAIVD